MRHVVEAVFSCPDGAVVGRELWVAENEEALEAMLHLKESYVYVTHLGAVREPGAWIQKRIATHQDKEG